MSEASFTRASRLLKPAEFKRVFDNTQWRSSTPQLLLLACANEQNQARVGFVLAKKQIKLAVERNRVKRIVRESFRQHQARLPAYDFVVLGRSGLTTLTNAEIRTMIDALWFKLKRPNNDRQANGRRNEKRVSQR
ncbi:MAG: ribonuclease P protein component [Venatoribacter sp.]